LEQLIGLNNSCRLIGELQSGKKFLFWQCELADAYHRKVCSWSESCASVHLRFRYVGLLALVNESISWNWKDLLIEELFI
jgi:hypothetical protein